MAQSHPLLAFIVGTMLFLASCGKHQHENRTPQTQPTASPNPAPVANLPQDAKAEDGFRVVDLIQSGKYCTVNRLGSQETFLLSYLDDNGLTYYFMDNGAVKYSSVESAARFQSECDLTQLKNTEPTTFLQSTIRVYADSNFDGEPFCTIAPGNTAISYSSVWTSTHGIEIINLSKLGCQGPERGFIKDEVPSLVDVYPVVSAANNN